MFRITLSRSKTILLASVLPIVSATSSQNPANKVLASKKETEEFVFVETGWDRVRNIFKSSEYEVISPELRVLFGATTTTLFVGSFLGVIIFSRHTYMHFMEKNIASQFRSHLDAKAVLTDNMNASMARGAFAWGGRFSLITFCWISLTRLIGAYRNENGLHNNIAGGVVCGALTGFLFRNLKVLQIEKSFPQLQRRLIGGSFSVAGGAAAGCLIGGAIGTFHLLFNELGDEKQNLRYWEQYWKTQQQQRRAKDPNYKPDN